MLYGCALEQPLEISCVDWEALFIRMCLFVRAVGNTEARLCRGSRD